MAVLSLGFVARSWRTLLVWSMPIYVLAAHFEVQLTLRYFYPAMPAVVLLAASGALGTWAFLTAKFSQPAAQVKGGTKRPPSSRKKVR